VQNRCRSESIQRYAAYSRLNYPIFGVYWLCATDKVFTETFAPTHLLMAARLSSEAIRKVLTTPFRDDFRGVATLRDRWPFAIGSPKGIKDSKEYHTVLIYCASCSVARAV
jgi:hypothetical protein